MEENSSFPNKKDRPILSDFIEELHRRGINVRHLGYSLIFAVILVGMEMLM